MKLSWPAERCSSRSDISWMGSCFAYGGSEKLKLSKMTEGEKDFVNRVQSTRDSRKLPPPTMATPEENEQIHRMN